MYIAKSHKRALLHTLLAVGKVEEVREEWRQATWLVSTTPQAPYRTVTVTVTVTTTATASHQQ